MMHHRGVRDASHRQLIAGFCHALCQPSVRRILHLDDSILATPQRVELLVHIARQPPVRDEWSEVVLAAVRGLEELSALDAGRHVLAQPTCIALAFLRDILRQSLPSTSAGAAAPAADSPQWDETGARRPEFAADGRLVVIASAVLERMANDGSVSQALLHHRLDEPITELLQRALEVEAQLRLRPAFNGKLAMLDNLTNLQVSFLLGSCSLHDVLPA